MLSGNYSVTGISFCLPLCVASGLSMYPLWLDTTDTGSAIELKLDESSFSVVWRLDSSHYHGLRIIVYFKYLEYRLCIVNFPPLHQKGKRRDWREKRNASVQVALWGTFCLWWLLCLAQQTGPQEEHVHVCWMRVFMIMLSSAKYGFSAALLSVVLELHEPVVVTVEDCWTFLLGLEGLCF